MPMTDEEIQRSVLEQFKWDAHVKPTEIGVAVKNGVVTLSGTVDSYTKKWNAEEIALRVQGVKVVANELDVVLPSSSVRTSAAGNVAVRAGARTRRHLPDGRRLRAGRDHLRRLHPARAFGGAGADDP